MNSTNVTTTRAVARLTTIRAARVRRGAAAMAVVTLALAGTAAAGIATPAAAAVPGLTIVRAASDWTSTAKSAYALCPDGTEPIGGGSGLGGTLSRGEVSVTDLRPVGRGIYAIAYEDADGFTSNWSVTAIAVCADPLPGLEVVSFTGWSDTVDDKQAYAYCPASKRLVGTAGQVDGAFGEAVLNGLIPYQSYVRVLGSEPSAVNGSWSLTAYAFCADPLPGLQIVHPTPANTTAGHKMVHAGCPSGTGVLDAGAEISPAVGEAVFTSLNPISYQGSEQVTAIADEYAGGSAGSWALHAYAICATL